MLRTDCHLQHIFHLNALADLVSVNQKCRSLEFGRAGHDRRVAGETKAFLGQENRHVHFAVGIFIVQQCDSIGPLGQPVKADLAGIAGRNFGATAFGVLAAIGEIFGVGRNADKDIALHAAQPIDADVKR